MRTPADVSSALRRVATKIEASKHPSASAVKKDLNEVLVELSPYRRACRNIAAQIVLLAAGEDMDEGTRKELIEYGKDKQTKEEIDKDIRSGLWSDYESSKELDTSWKAAKNADTADILKHALKGISDDAIDFMHEIEGKKTKRQDLREDDQGVFTSAPKHPGKP